MYKKYKKQHNTLNEKYFDKIDSQEKAYFLGWIISDGWIGGTEKHTLKNGKVAYYIRKNINLKLHTKDSYILEDFKKALEFTGPITSRKNLRKSKVSSVSEIRINSAYMRKTLMNKYGLVPKKSGYEVFPKIPNKFIPGLISGLFAGDGSVSIVRDKRVKNVNLGYRVKSDFCGSYKLLVKLREQLLCNGVLNKESTIYREGSSGILYRFCLTKSETLNFYYWVKKFNVPFLKRKEDVIKKFLQYFKTKSKAKPWHQRSIVLTDVKTGKKYKFSTIKNASKFAGYSCQAGISTAISRKQKLIQGRYEYKVGNLQRN